MSRDYHFQCKTCNDKVDYEKDMDSIQRQCAELEDIFFFEVAFDNCTSIDDKSPIVDVEKLREWLIKHEGHQIYFGW